MFLLFGVLEDFVLRGQETVCVRMYERRDVPKNVYRARAHDDDAKAKRKGDALRCRCFRSGTVDSRVITFGHSTHSVLLPPHQHHNSAKTVATAKRTQGKSIRYSERTSDERSKKGV